MEERDGVPYPGWHAALPRGRLYLFVELATQGPR